MLVRVRQNRWANASHRLAAAILLVNLPLRLGPQGAVIVREDRHVRMFLVELLERVPDRLHAAARLLGNPLGDLRGTAARLGQTPRSLDNLLALLVRQLAELGAAANPLLVVRHEAIHRTLEKADPLAAVEQESPTDQPLLAPSGDRFRRYAELPAPTRRPSAPARRLPRQALLPRRTSPRRTAANHGEPLHR